jgi:hypothetical protein
MVEKIPFLSDRFQFALASIAAYSGLIDHMVEHVIDELFDPDQNVAKFLLKQGTSGDRLIDLLKALLFDRFPADTDEIEANIALIKKVRNDRNDLFHGLWGPERIQDTFTATHRRPHREDRSISKTVEEISAISDQMIASTKWLQSRGERFRNERLAELQARLGKPVPQLGLLASLGTRPPDTPGPPSPQQPSLKE